MPLMVVRPNIDKHASALTTSRIASDGNRKSLAQPGGGSG